MSDEKLTKKLQDDITKVLKEHMPEYVCGVVKERLDQADEMERRIAEQDETIAANSKELCELRDLKLCADKLEKWVADLQAQEAQLVHEQGVFERDKRVFELEHKLAAANTVKAHIMTVNENLTKNVEHRRRITRSEDIINPAYTDQYGSHYNPSNSGYRQNTDTDITESVKLDGEM